MNCLSFFYILLFCLVTESFKAGHVASTITASSLLYNHNVLEEVATNSNIVTAEIDLIDGKMPEIRQRNKRTSANLFKISISRIVLAMESIFLPVGFPSTVPPEYAKFQVWNLIQDFCSYLRGIMSTKAILEGFGVGRSDVTAVQATIQWIFRDGASLIGGLLFTSLSSHDFGQNVKLWRLFADAINNVGITLEIIAPFYRKHFLLVICIASICKALCGVAAGATGAAIAEHWGQSNGNIADVLAKSNAQHTVVSLLGLLISVPFTEFASSSPQLLSSTYAFLTILHLVANYKAMRVLALKSINSSRYDILIKSFLENEEVSRQLLQMSEKFATVENQNFINDNISGIQQWLNKNSEIFSVPHIAKKEPIVRLVVPQSLRRFINRLFIDDRNGNGGRIDVNSWISPSFIARHFSSSDIETAMRTYATMPYFIIADENESGGTRGIYLCLSDHADGYNQAQALFEACTLRILLLNQQCLKGDTASSSIKLLPTATRKLTSHIFPMFWNHLSDNGWKCSLPQLQPLKAKVYRYIS